MGHHPMALEGDHSKKKEIKRGENKEIWEFSGIKGTVKGHRIKNPPVSARDAAARSHHIAAEEAYQTT